MQAQKQTKIDIIEDANLYITQKEQRILELLGPTIFNYEYVLDPHSKSEFSIEKISASAKQAIEDYNATVLEFFEKSKIPYSPNETDSFKKFIKISRELYLARFLQARLFFAEYALVRTFTRVEAGIINEENLDPIDELPTTISLVVPQEAFVLNKNGSINFKKTIENENKTNLIKASLTTFGNLYEFSEKFYYDFTSITIKGFLPTLHRKNFIDVTDAIIQEITLLITRRIYSYVDRGYNLFEARNNVSGYFTRLIGEEYTVFPEELKLFEKSIEEKMNLFLKEYTTADKNTAEIILEDYKNLILFYLSKEMLVPTNYYDVLFRDRTRFLEYEFRYHYLIDTYLLDDYSKPMDIPLETYDIDYSNEAKEIIFEAVTNNIINPNFTLDDYLSRV